MTKMTLITIAGGIWSQSGAGKSLVGKAETAALQASARPIFAGIYEPACSRIFIEGKDRLAVLRKCFAEYMYRMGLVTREHERQ